MSHKMLTSLVVGSGLVLIAALTIGPQAQAGPAAPAGGMQMTETQMKDHCKGMMEQKKKLAADVKSQDAELTELVAKMNRAPGDKQMTLMATVITQIVEQQVAMNQRKSKNGRRNDGAHDGAHADGQGRHGPVSDDERHGRHEGNVGHAGHEEHGRQVGRRPLSRNGKNGNNE